MLAIKAIDHFVLTVRDIQATCEFYSRVLGMGITVFEDNRTTLTFGQQKINLHLAGREFEPKALHPAPGTVDVCFTTDGSLDDWTNQLRRNSVSILLGPIAQVGAVGKMQSLYCRDPDGNLIEIATYDRQ